MNIFIFKDGEQQGPYTIAEARRRCLEGKVNETDPAWHEGLADWVPLNEISGFSYLAKPAFAPPGIAPKGRPASAPQSHAAVGFQPARSHAVKQFGGAAILFAIWVVVLFFLIYGSALVIGGGIAATRASWNAHPQDYQQFYNVCWPAAQKFDGDDASLIFDRSILAAGLVAIVLAVWAHWSNSVTEGFHLLKRFIPVVASFIPTFLAFYFLFYILGFLIGGGIYGFHASQGMPAQSNYAAVLKARTEDGARLYREYGFTIFIGAGVAAFVVAELLSFAAFLQDCETAASVFFKRLATAYVLFQLIFVFLVVLIYLVCLLVFGVHLTADQLMAVGQAQTAEQKLTLAKESYTFTLSVLISGLLAVLVSLFFAFQIAFSEALPWCRSPSGPRHSRRIRSVL